MSTTATPGGAHEKAAACLCPVSPAAASLPAAASARPCGRPGCGLTSGSHISAEPFRREVSLELPCGLTLDVLDLEASCSSLRPALAPRTPAAGPCPSTGPGRGEGGFRHIRCEERRGLRWAVGGHSEKGGGLGLEAGDRRVAKAGQKECQGGREKTEKTEVGPLSSADRRCTGQGHR